MPAPEDAAPRIGVQGWREFAAEKLELLAEYDLARQRAASRPVKTEPGMIAEAVFRRWLARFLPGRYGVTSGYIISTGRSDHEPLRHFDVIIYDKLNSPVLWHTGNPDKSAQGDELGLPVEHVLTVFEVKSTLSKKSASEAATKLMELAPLLANIDGYKSFNPTYLPSQFLCGVIFFGAATNLKHQGSALNPLAGLRPRLRGFEGGIILSSPDDASRNLAANIVPLRSEQPVMSNVARGKASLFEGVPVSDSVRIGEDHFIVHLTWSDNAFAMFAHNLVAQLKGTYTPGHMSSMHGLNLYRYESGQDSRFPLDGGNVTG